ncbi:hypothetical protein FDF29_06465 [Clostridium botulinum]|uniref:Hypothetical phage protein n=1 Tax=Clostridium botulinum (strain Hall / ATCC 3502 / NCTC 13319 / Type A) TaxID=441771 RepID=A5I4D0_CLOBH|nr:hypothetical protein [Clostridium botulinum]NFL68456.1 hypothetical protein [Clostridium botulinum]NFQ52993.1 hypothetical protein [Clostridium botulinum]NFT45893.1 hypothetical protein [Clostridium botulinum]QGT41831.1 hypothetical protein GJ703_00008 [Clostridium botulinum]CAL83902.1 hypothetical phage protein [Clostridium botulinum A str. ATCC 3502]
MFIKILCLANGDCYKNVTTDLEEIEFKNKIDKGEWVEIKQSNKKIVINSEFIISYEIGESKLKTI